MIKLGRLLVLCQVIFAVLLSGNLFAQSKYVTFTIPLSKQPSLEAYKGVDISLDGTGDAKSTNGCPGKLNAWVNGPVVNKVIPCTPTPPETGCYDGTYVGKYYEHDSTTVSVPYPDGTKVEIFQPATVDPSAWIDPSDKKFIDKNGLTMNFADHNGIFGRDENGDMFLYKYDDRTQVPTKVLFAFQNGPILLLDGVNPHHGTGKAKRTGIGFRSDTKSKRDKNDIVVISTLVPVSMKELGEFFRAEGCENAIYLDGGVDEYIGYATYNKKDPVGKGRKAIQFFHVCSGTGNGEVAVETK